MSTLSTLQSNVCGALGLNNATAANGGDQDRVTGWLNDAVLDVLLRTHCYVTVATETLTANSNDYSPSTSILAIEEMYLTSGSTSYPLEARPARQLINMRINSAASSPPVYYAQMGASLITFYPTPSAADVLTLYYVPVPTAMSSGSHDPSSTTYGGIPTQFHYGLELYAMWKGGAYKKDINSQQGERYRAEYEGQNSNGGFLMKMKGHLARMGGKPLGYFVIPGQNTPVAHDPSQDIRGYGG